MRWVDTLGGPLVSMDAHLLAAWQGATSFPAPGTDYDRACQVTGYLGIIPVAEGSALVFGDEPMATAWWPNPRWGSGLVVRWMYAPDEDAVLRHLGGLPDIPYADSVTWHVSDDKQLLFDSALTGGEGSAEGIQLSLPRGSYRVDTHVYQPDDATSLVLHRVQRHDAADKRRL